MGSIRPVRRSHAIAHPPRVHELTIGRFCASSSPVPAESSIPNRVATKMTVRVVFHIYSFFPTGPVKLLTTGRPHAPPPANPCFRCIPLFSVHHSVFGPSWCFRTTEGAGQRRDPRVVPSVWDVGMSRAATGSRRRTSRSTRHDLKNHRWRKNRCVCHSRYRPVWFWVDCT